jgi:nitroreductase
MDAIDVIMKRRSVRKYREAAIPEEDLQKILESGRQAPSAGNRQPWHFVVTRDPKVKVKLGEACRGQMWVADADVILTGIGIPAIGKGSTGRLWHPVDVAIAMQNMILASADLGYGTCWIGAFEENKVKSILKIPENMEVIALTPIGVPAESPGPRSRKPSTDVFSSDMYGGGKVY